MRVQLKKTIPPVFWPVHAAIRSGTVQEVVAKGGRGSGKSSYLSLELVYQLLRHPDCHAVVLRKVAGTLRNSVYCPVKPAKADSALVLMEQGILDIARDGVTAEELDKVKQFELKRSEEHTSELQSR